VNDQRRASILIVDDHEIVRDGLIASLGTATRELSGVGTGRDALDRVRERGADVVVVDLRLPDMSGHELIAAIREAAPATRIVVLSTYLSEQSVQSAYDAGADAYVAKSSGMGELNAALGRVLDGQALDESAAETVHRLREGQDDARVRITLQQERVLVLAAAGATDKEIAAALFITESTVRFHMQRVKELLGARSKTQAIAEAIRRELIRPEPL